MKLSTNDIRINGSHYVEDDLLYLESSGTFIEFEGDFKMITADIVGDDGYPAFLAVIIDGMESEARYLEILNGENNYLLFESRQFIHATIRILKTTEAQYGHVAFRSIFVDGTASKTKRQDFRIFFIGDSLTCGYGVDGVDGEIFTTRTENFIKAYPYLLAKRLDADYDTLCSSGDGIVSRYISLEEDEPLSMELIPDLYDAWTNRTPEYEKTFDLIVINLGTNDASYTRSIKEREQYFKDQYKKFLINVSKSVDHSKIFVVYGVMENTLSPVIQETITELESEGIDIVYTDIKIDDKNKGIAGHPGVLAHEQIADILYRKIIENS